MKVTRLYAVSALAAMSFTVTLAQAADLPTKQSEARCSAYRSVPVSMAISKSKAAILANSSFYKPNRFRAGLGPHHYASFYDPIRPCDLSYSRQRAAKKRRY